MGIEHLPREMVYMICTYLSLDDILNLKVCFPESISCCGILYNYLLPYKTKRLEHLNLYNKIQKECKKKLNRKMVLGHMKICPHEVHDLRSQAQNAIFHLCQMLYHNSVYQNLLYKMELGKFNRLKNVRCFGCKKVFRRCNEFILHLRLIFPFCIGEFQFLGTFEDLHSINMTGRWKDICLCTHF